MDGVETTITNPDPFSVSTIFCASSTYPKAVTIYQVANGFIVKIGCKTFVETDWDKVADALGKYWEDPEAAEKEYCK